MCIVGVLRFADTVFSVSKGCFRMASTAVVGVGSSSGASDENSRGPSCAPMIASSAAAAAAGRHSGSEGGGGGGGGAGGGGSLFRALSKECPRSKSLRWLMPEGYQILHTVLKETPVQADSQTTRRSRDDILVDLVKWATGTKDLQFACKAIADLLLAAPEVNRHTVVPGDLNLAWLCLADRLSRAPADGAEEGVVAAHWTQFEADIGLLVLASGFDEERLQPQLTEAHRLARAHGAIAAKRVLVLAGATPAGGEPDPKSDPRSLIKELLSRHPPSTTRSLKTFA